LVIEQFKPSFVLCQSIVYDHYSELGLPLCQLIVHSLYSINHLTHKSDQSLTCNGWNKTNSKKEEYHNQWRTLVLMRPVLCADTPLRLKIYTYYLEFFILFSLFYIFQPTAQFLYIEILPCPFSLLRDCFSKKIKQPCSVKQPFRWINPYLSDIWPIYNLKLYSLYYI
jgi:hypothetical protein